MPAPVRVKNLCTCCGVRWKQGRRGLCRRCERQLAGDTRNTVAREAEVVGRQQRYLELKKREYQRPPRFRVVDGVEYQIQFDGT
jgi:hypothetical protein